MKTDKEYQILYDANKGLQRAYKAEILAGHEREKQAKKARLELMLELSHRDAAYDKLTEEFRAVCAQKY